MINQHVAAVAVIDAKLLRIEHAYNRQQIRQVAIGGGGFLPTPRVVFELLRRRVMAGDSKWAGHWVPTCESRWS